ncbi:MAG TPA: TonB family protein [Candidatus Polarisedimenticolaceae bacterium]
MDRMGAEIRKVGRPMRWAALAIALGALAGHGWAATDSSCARWELEGLAPGMSAEEVLAKRPAAGMRSLLREPGGVETSGVHYPGPPLDLYVEFDGRIDRRPPPRAVRVRVAMPPSPTAAREILERFGPPRVGAVELENGLHEGTAVWVDDRCGVVLTAQVPPADWWLPRVGLVLELQPLGFVRSGIAIANAGLKRTLEQVGATAEPTATPPVVDEVVEEPPATPPVVEEIVEEPPVTPPVVDEIVEEPPATPPVVDEVVEEPPATQPVVDEVVEKPPVSEPPAKPATIATWRPAIKAPAAAPPNPAPPATIATWKPGAAAAPSRDNGNAKPPTDRPAERIAFVPAVVPPTAKWLGLKGEVTLKVLVKVDGSVANPRVVVARPAGRGFEEAAVDAARQWRYAPAVVGGRPVDSELVIRIDFE